MEESRITEAHSRIITPHVVRAAKEAGGQENKGCVVRGYSDTCYIYCGNHPLIILGLLFARQPTLVLA